MADNSWLDSQSSVVGPQDTSWLDASSSHVGAIAPRTNYGSPTDQGDTLQVYNPFGSNLDTGVRLWPSINNLLAGAGKTYTDLGLGMRQLYGLVSGNSIDQEVAEKRSIDTALSNTTAGKLGQVGAAAVPLAFLPGANTVAGSAALGAGMGALQPTMGNESRLANTAIGGALGGATAWAGTTLGNYLKARAAQPFMGYSAKGGNAALAGAVGSDAEALIQPELNAAANRLQGIFQQVRSPNVQTTLGQPSMQAYSAIESGVGNPSARQAFESGASDFLDALTSGQPVSAKRLGQISTSLRQESSSMLSAEGGNREAGLALKALKEHVDDVLGSTIRDPALKAAYTAARPQYGVLQDVIDNPTLLNSATGRANMTAYGKYLQRNDPMGYSRGLNTSGLYNAARWGQANPISATDPSLMQMIRHPLQFAASKTLETGPGRFATGVASRIPGLSPLARYGLPGVGYDAEAQLVPYLEQ